MASTSETGHAKNVGNFQRLINFVTSYGAEYNPSKTELKLPALNALKTAASTAMADVVAKKQAENDRTNERSAAFAVVPKLATRLINALEATDASEEKLEDAKGFNRKIQGKSASSDRKSPDAKTGEPESDPISSSQKSFDQIIEHLSGLLAVLESEPTYDPNEEELKTATISALIEDLTAVNNAAETAITNVSNARIDRNKILYTNEDSIVETAEDVKKYVKSIYGASNPKYEQVQSIEFKKIK